MSSSSIITVGVDISDAPSGTYSKVKELLEAHGATYIYAKPLFGFNPHAILDHEGKVDNDRGASLVVSLHGIDGARIVYSAAELHAHFGDRAAAPVSDPAPSSVSAGVPAPTVLVQPAEAPAPDDASEFEVVAEDGEVSPLLLSLGDTFIMPEPEPEPVTVAEPVLTDRTRKVLGHLTVPWRGTLDAQHPNGTLARRRICTTHTTDGSRAVFAYLDKPFRPLGIYASAHAARAALLAEFPPLAAE